LCREQTHDAVRNIPRLLAWYHATEVVTAFSSFRFPELSQPI